MQIKVKRISTKDLYQKLQTKKIKQSIKFLTQNRTYISHFNGIEDFVYYVSNPYIENYLRGFNYHFKYFSLELAKKLWSKQVLIGISVVEELLFSVIQDTTVADPLKEFLDRLQKFGLHKPGFIIYPIHSFGVTNFGFYRSLKKTEAYFLLADLGIAVTPQLNSKNKLYSLLDEITNDIGIKQKIPENLLEHYIKSRSLNWLIYNPLLVVRARTFSGEAYENQFLLLIKLKISKAILLMLSVLGSTLDRTARDQTFFSSSSINNFQTLDIKHYLVFQPSIGKKKYLTLDCVPMNVNQIELAEIASLNIELDPSKWRRRFKLLNRVKNALSKFQEYYIYHCISSTKETVKTRVTRKIFDSLKYFDRSFREFSSFEDSIVNLAIAFEVLLIDHYSPGVIDKLIKHLKFALRNVKGTRRFQECVRDLYKSRGGIVHSGRIEINPDLVSCRKAYVYAFLSIVERLDQLPTHSGTPMSDLLTK